jgi:hypothetical protein
MNKWMDKNPKRCKVHELTPNASDYFKDCEVTLAQDPSDIVLFGDDLRHCLNLNGRLNRVLGLFAFLVNGKTHMIVAKSSRKGASIAQVPILLLWDETKKQPVLFLELMYFKGKERNDFTLENALLAYAKQMSAALEVPLVVSGYKNDDPNTSVVGEEYQGSIVSLKTSSPFEYVDSIGRLVKPPYSLGRCYFIQ